MNTQERIIHLVSWLADVPYQNISLSTHIRDDLNVDSIDFMLLVVRLERFFQVSLSTEEVESIETVKDACDCIERCLRRTNPLAAYN